MDNNLNSNNDTNTYYGVNGNPFGPGKSVEIKSVISRTDVETYVKWGKILGIIIIIMGAFQCLSCIGAAMGVPLIIAGSKINKSSQTLERSLFFDDEMSVGAAFSDIAEGTKIIALVTLLSFILSIILMIVYIAVVIPLVMSSMQ